MSLSKRQLTVVLVTSLFAIAFVAWMIGWRFWVYQNVHVPLQSRAELIMKDLAAQGARVQAPALVEGLPAVEQVVTVEVDGQTVRLLEFDESKPDQAAELQRIRREKTVKVGGKDQPAEEKGGVVMIDFETHPRKEAILKAFHGE